MSIVHRPRAPVMRRAASIVRPAVVLLAVFLSALSVAMFIWGLGLNYPLVGKF